MNSNIQDQTTLAKSQYKTADKVKARWDLYAHALPFVDIHLEGLNHLKLKGGEDILEVGCSDGRVLRELRENRGHFGRLAGLDITETIFEPAPQLSLEFVVGLADALPYPDASFDVILAYFMLYHMPDIPKTLQEWKRVLRPGGRVLAATASATNKPFQKQIKKEVSALLGVDTPSAFSSSFNLENGAEQLAKVFAIEESYIWDAIIELQDPEPYIRSFSSTRDMCVPVPSEKEWQRAEHYMAEKIQKEIVEKGKFTELVRRGFFIARRSQ